ncbi:HAMP domain-containing protein [Chitinimonas arctica]|uniref:histidine kinase n=1 Tax=Chitinimonas arctica TaxID=2594795 RepID=A0A516SGF5_9NEIS|nr:ATP-binding protein [Chitinimonas arctica]QDQ27180.1 HAMP domain-containing protein [Chitinimonas arctica]
MPLRNTLILIGSLAVILLFMLATSIGNSTVFGRYYHPLLALNVLVVAGLVVLVGARLMRLRKQVRARQFGSRLAWRLTLMFGMVAILPGALVYTLSVQFLTKSIETWFDVKVDTALDSGLNLGNQMLNYSLDDLMRKAQLMAGELSSGEMDEAHRTLTRLREATGVQEASLFDGRGRVLDHVGDTYANLVPLVPERAVLKRALEQKPYRQLETTPNYGLSLRVIVPVNPNYASQSGFGGEIRILQLIQPVPKQLASDAEKVEEMRNAYKLLSLSRAGLKQSYSLTLTLALLLALLTAVVLGMYLSEKLAAPLTVLAAGTRAVAQGDFSQVQPVVSQDELGTLTHSFNRMTRQLSDARDQVELKQQETAAAKAYLETVLGSLTAGVLTFDEQWRLRAGNLSAGNILHADIDKLDERRLDDCLLEYPHLSGFAIGVQQAFEAGTEDWQRQLEVGFDGSTRMLLVHGARLRGEVDQASGAVVVFDDVTDLLRAQRDAAWGEVAKRLAHEIRNPLTPIQLAAERLAHKLADKLDDASREILTRSTNTIVAQVGALKRMVDEFREYARQPSAELAPVNLAKLLDEIMVLYETAPIEREHVGDGELVVMADITQLRQVVHNLLKNAQEAVSGDIFGRIRLRTERREKAVRLSVEDNGTGFSEAILQRVFEPYATTKQKGTGLGLAVVKKIIDEHHGQIVAFNVEPHGGCVRIDLPAVVTINADNSLNSGENARGE